MNNFKIVFLIEYLRKDFFLSSQQRMNAHFIQQQHYLSIPKKKKKKNLKKKTFGTLQRLWNIFDIRFISLQPFIQRQSQYQHATSLLSLYLPSFTLRVASSICIAFKARFFSPSTSSSSCSSSSSLSVTVVKVL